MGHYIELPKLVHPDFAFPWKKPVDPVRIDATSSIPRPNHLYGFSKAGRLIDFTGGHHSDPFDVNTKIARNRIVFNGTTGSQIEFPDTSHSGNSSIFCDRAQFTVSTVINFSGGTSPGILGDFYGSSNVSVLLWLDSSGRVNFRTRCAGVLKTINGTANLIDGADHHIIAQYDGANMYLIADGQQVATTAQTGNTSPGFTSLLAIGSYRAGWSGNVPVGSIDHVAIWWSAPNWEAIAKRRFDFLEPAIPMPYFIPSAGGGVALSVNSLSQGQSFGSPALTQHSALTANDIAQGQQLDQPVLTQHYILSTDDMTQTEVLGSPTLTQAHILSVEALSQAQSLSQPGLTQHHVLAANALSQSQVLGNVTLTIADAISPASLSQSQLFDAPTLTQHHVLSVAGLAQTNTLGNVLLTVAGTLNVSDLEQGQTIPQATLLQHHVLSVNSLLQAQSMGNVTLTAAELLTVASMAQAQVIGSPDLTQHGILSVDELTQAQILQIVSLGGAVIGRLDGRVVIYSALSGRVNIAPALDGKIVIN